MALKASKSRFYGVFSHNTSLDKVSGKGTELADEPLSSQFESIHNFLNAIHLNKEETRTAAQTISPLGQMSERGGAAR